MPTPVHLTVPEPCHENWQQMTPNEQGRHCLSCQKTVVDFSVMSDQEILTYFSRASSQVCGRFDNRQLNKTYGSKNSKKPFSWRYAWSMVIAALLITSDAVMGQSKTSSKKRSHKSKRFRGLKSIIKWNSKVILFKVDGWQTMTYGYVVSSHEYKADLPSIDYLHPASLTVQPTPAFSAAKIETPVKPVEDIPRPDSLPDVTVEELKATNKASVKEKIRKEIKEWLPQKEVRIYPNPVVAGNSVTVSMTLPQTGHYRMELIDAAGKMVWSQIVLISKDTQTITMPTQSFWAKGIYWLRLSSKTNKVYEATLLLQ